MFVISQDQNGNLQKANSRLKENLKLWIDSYRMISDSIDIFDAKILNFGIDFDVIIKDVVNTQTALSEIRNEIYEEITLSAPEIGQSFSIGEVERILNSIPIVDRVNSVKIKIKTSQNHSSSRYDIPGNVSPDGGLILLPEDSIWEIKYLEDITGKF